MARDESINARALTAWELTLAALQRDDSSVTEVNVHYYDDSIPHPNGQPLGVNLMLSSTVTELVLEVPRQYLEGEPITTDEFALLLHYVATSAALRTVLLQQPCFTASTVTSISIFVEQIMRAARRNNNIRALKLCDYVAYDPLQMVEFLGQTTSLQEIMLYVSRSVLSDESRLNVLEALARSAQISYLILGFEKKDGLEMFADSLQLLHKSTTLQKLHLSFLEEIPLVPGYVWSSFLQDAIALHCLSLFCMPFDRDAMKGLVEGLISRNAAAIDLELDACDFDNGAIDELFCSIPTMDKHIFSTLKITQMGHYDDDDTRMNALLKGLVAKVYPVSPFQHLVLDLDGEDFTLALLRRLAKAPPQMESLALVGNYGIPPAVTKAVAAIVKSAVCLKKLSVESACRSPKFCVALEEALRVNGSIVDVCERLTRKYSFQVSFRSPRLPRRWRITRFSWDCWA
jgi:hypothetical protein